MAAVARGGGGRLRMIGVIEILLPELVTRIR